MGDNIYYIGGFLAFTCYSITAAGFMLLIPPPHHARRDKEQYYSYYSTHVSLIHCVMSMGLFILKMIWYGWDFCGENRDFYYLVAMNSFGYFLFDLVYGEMFQCQDNVFRVHHILSLYGIINAFSSNYSMSEVITGIFIAEVSNPFLQTYIILCARGVFQGSFVWANNAFLFGTWLFCRHLWGIPYVIQNYTCTKGSLIIYMLSSLFIFLSTFWTMEILVKFRKILNLVYQDWRPWWVAAYDSSIGRFSQSFPAVLSYHIIVLVLVSVVPISIRLYMDGQFRHFPLDI